MKRKTINTLAGIAAAFLLTVCGTAGIMGDPLNPEDLIDNSEIIEQIKQAEAIRSSDNEVKKRELQISDLICDDQVTIYEDTTIEVITEEGVYMKIRPPFGMLGLTRDFVAQLDSYVYFPDPLKVLDDLKASNTHIFIYDLLSGLNINVTTIAGGAGDLISDMDDITESDRNTLAETLTEAAGVDVSVIKRGDNHYFQYDYGIVKMYESVKNKTCIDIIVIPSNGSLDEFDIKNVEKILGEAVYSFEQK